ncbi:MAG: hypothetical protein ACREOJ_11995 [Gemmatimonadaceae bacterium]
MIDLRTAPPPQAPFAGQVRGWGGSGSLSRFTGTFGGTDGAVGFQGDISHTEQDGYREFSHQRVTSGYGKVDWHNDRTDLSMQVLGYDMPLGQNPGALTRAQLDSDRTMAAARATSCPGHSSHCPTGSPLEWTCRSRMTCARTGRTATGSLPWTVIAR